MNGDGNEDENGIGGIIGEIGAETETGAGTGTKTATRAERRVEGKREFFSFFFFNLTYSRWTSSFPSCLWPLRIFPSLPGSRLTIFIAMQVQHSYNSSING